MYIVLSFLLLCCLYFSFAELDEGVLEKDLYATLGVSRDATLKEIKKSFKALAKKHHPDKSQPSSKEANARIFTEVAEAYEVLSDAETRREYNRYRQQRQHQQDQHNRYQQNNRQDDESVQQQHQERYRQQQRHRREEEAYMENLFQNYFMHAQEQFLRQQPPFSVIGSLIVSSQPVFPYQPILTAEGHYAFLDKHCSLAVVRGDVHEYLRLFATSGLPPDLTRMPGVQVKFRTEGNPALASKCFLGLDETGILRIFRGHPDYEYSPIWTSELSEEAVPFASPFTQRFYLELRDTGELAVLRMILGDSEAVCIWSTTNCNSILNVITEAKTRLASFIQNILSLLRARLARFDSFFTSEFFENIPSLAREKFQSFRELVEDVDLDTLRSSWQWRIEKLRDRVQELAESLPEKLKRIGDTFARKTRNFWERRGVP